MRSVDVSSQGDPAYSSQCRDIISFGFPADAMELGMAEYGFYPSDTVSVHYTCTKSEAIRYRYRTPSATYAISIAEEAQRRTEAQGGGRKLKVKAKIRQFSCLAPLYMDRVLRKYVSIRLQYVT